MAPELVAGGGYGGLIREKPHCALGRGTTVYVTTRNYKQRSNIEC